VAGEELRRLEEARARNKHWRRWGPYLAERAWGTVREDYSARGDAWADFPREQAPSRAYRWNEDGIAGVSDRHQRICFALAMWNGRDPILKERLFGLAGPEGNHGEDVKEQYFYLDSTPTHSFMRYLYKYPHERFPYEELVAENARRSRKDPEYELLDTGVLQRGYFDVHVDYAKGDVEDLLIRITVTNRGERAATIDLLPTVWFRNTWSWGHRTHKPRLWRDGDRVRVEDPHYGHRYFSVHGDAELLFTENESNKEKLWGEKNPTPFVKDAFHARLIEGRADAVNPGQEGTKVAAWRRVLLQPGESHVMRLRVSDRDAQFVDFDDVFAARHREADEFYASIAPELTREAQNVMRQSLAGLLWSKQFYHYVVRDWLEGDPSGPKPPDARKGGRNRDWPHLYNADVISMPDKWEYPWYAAWDLAFHCVPLAMVDSDFAKEQLILLLREWYMHPSGQIPAYEWQFSDVNPPVHAWAALRVYKIEKKRRGEGDRVFLERVFQKLLLNFTWWVNRKDRNGRNVFQGGFLGLDNIGVFDRSAPLPTGGYIEQSDGTAWMAMYCLNMLAIALELARDNAAYEDVASKFWEHFVHIGHALNTLGLWNDEDGLFYDVLHLPSGKKMPMKVRSMVGLAPLFAVEVLDAELLDALPAFKRRMEWFLENRQDLVAHLACMKTPGDRDRRLMSVVPVDRLRRVLTVMLDEQEFLAPYGVRALSARHRREPFVMRVDGHEHRVDYEPGESSSPLFGGNSNWRGPIWFPMNYLLIESLQKYGYYFGDRLQIELPTHSGKRVRLAEVAAELSRRLVRIFLPDATGRRPFTGRDEIFDRDPHFRELLLFHEYFHGDSGAGLGATHQTGWTALVAKLLQQSGE